MEQAKPTKVWLLDENELQMSSRTAETYSIGGETMDYCVIMDKRTSEMSAFSGTHDEDVDDVDFGALRPGGALNLLSLEAFGLLSQYAGVGILMGVFNALQYPLFQNYLHMEGYQSASYRVLISLGWSSKIFFGILSDCLPVFGYKRRPYMVLGWAMCGVCCLMMAITPFPAPYYGSKELKGIPTSNMTADQLKLINLAAPTSASFFIVMSMLGSLGYVMADVAADAMVVQYAQREPAAIRGRVQTAIYFTRDSFTMVPMLVVAFCMNDYKYGGSFSWSIGPNVVYAGLTVPCFLAAYTAFALMVEEKVDHVHITEYMQNAWLLLQKRVVWQICAFKFFNGVFFGYQSTLNDPISSIWVKVQPLVATSFSILSQLFRVVAMFAIGKYALNWDWRWAIALSTILLVVFDTAWHFLAIWDIYRNQYFHSAMNSLEAFPSATLFLFGAYILVEVVEEGNEGLVYALVATCNNLASPLSTVVAKTIDSFWDARLSDIQRDDSTVRWQITYSFIMAAAFKLGSLAFLVLLPRQKEYVQVLKRTGSLSKLAGGLVVFLFLLGYAYNLTTNLLSIYPSTSCLRIAGGKGC
ncbi:hypothetical protein Ae201684_014140 [Aphanomyces euteiches]|uniref:Major facilitator superfamily associated domain-containing protein n=1 Tax=Aphanomyces euteiches TaxID=100861 RepID=A0A6G0WKU4_9STRA|nr:hypothetical protein Ae201684_014140 [Aphanomyces euteiches]